MSSAWLLQGGSSLGAAQVGMARALMEAGHWPDMLFGASAGALNAAWLASEPTLEGLTSLAELWARVRRGRIFPLRPWPLLPGLLGLSDHVISSTGLESWLRSSTRLARVEDGLLPLTVVATDVSTGAEVLIDRGPLVPALMASSALPGIFPPVEVDGRWLIDGSIAMDTPIAPAVGAGATQVWALQGAPVGPMGRPRSALGVVLQSSAILLRRNHETMAEQWCARCELFVVPAPVVPGVSPFDFRHSRALVEAGYRSTQEWLLEARPVQLAPAPEHRQHRPAPSAAESVKG